MESGSFEEVKNAGAKKGSPDPTSSSLCFLALILSFHYTAEANTRFQLFQPKLLGSFQGCWFTKVTDTFIALPLMLPAKRSGFVLHGLCWMV